jgi:hypothetical protein
MVRSRRDAPRRDEALDEIAAKLHATAAEFGLESILRYSYAGTMGYLNNAGPSCGRNGLRLWRRCGAEDGAGAPDGIRVRDNGPPCRTGSRA